MNVHITLRWLALLVLALDLAACTPAAAPPPRLPTATSVPVAQPIPSITPESLALEPTIIRPRPTPRTTVRAMDSMTMVYVPAGTFKMGSETGEDNEKPVHDVTLDAFWIDRTEVTNAQYAKCVSAGKCAAPSETKPATRSSYYGNSQYADYPVILVSWDDANNYCTWAGGQLPPEAQWEYAARGPQGYTYPWGNDEPNHTLLNHNLDVGDTTAVGSYPAGASWVGALDLAGNVGEWVQDWYGPYPSSAQTNPTGPTSGTYRVLRGGAWSYYAANNSMAYRMYTTPDVRYDNLGVRCAAAGPGG